MRTIIHIFRIAFWLLPALLPAQPTTWQALATRIPGLEARRTAHLEQEWQVEEAEPNILKMTHKETGMVKYVDITDHTFDFDNPPANVQVIDLINADTTLYNHKYIRKNVFPIGSLLGYPMTIGDFNNNGKLDLCGSYKIPQDLEIADCAIAELQEDSTFAIKKIYTDSVFFSLASTDLDNDNLQEINLRRNQLFYNYEASHPDSFPNVFNFSHRMWQISNAVGSETFTDLDNDGISDVLYVGDDSLPPSGQKIFVAEYNPAFNRFEKKFSIRPTPEWRVSGFSVGDFDSDGFKEFVTGSIDGDIYVFENTGNDSYQQVFHDTITAPNAYMTGTTDDIDGNGKIEFFVGGSAFYNGTPASRVYWFEAAGNSYIKVRSVFLLGTDVLGTTELFIHDVNQDGTNDLVFSFSFSVAILIWNPNSEQFDLFYLDWWENFDQTIESSNMYDVYDMGMLDLFVNVRDLYSIPRIRTYFYAANPLTGINTPIIPLTNFNLYQNYPNPFNSSTRLRFQLAERCRISLIIYDITGKEVIRLINNQVNAPGTHEVMWNGLNNKRKEVSSGIYFYELRGGGFKQIKKMVFIQ